MKIELKSKPIPVPLIYQPIYKLVMLLAVLKYGTRSPHCAPLVTLHIYLWALRRPENFAVIIDISNKTRNSIVPWSFEPGLEKTITLALVNGYCEKVIKGADANGSGDFEIQLSHSGARTLSEIESLNIFDSEFTKIRSIGVISKQRLLNVSKNWSII